MFKNLEKLKFEQHKKVPQNSVKLKKIKLMRLSKSLEILGHKGAIFRYDKNRFYFTEKMLMFEKIIKYVILLYSV